MDSLDIFISQLDRAIEIFPKFQKITTDSGLTILRGELDIVDNGGKYWDSYQVEIHSTDGFPFKFPRVFEIGGKIPRIADWHIYEDTLSCCIAVEPEEYLICKMGLSVSDFIKNEVVPYFFNQTFRKVEGYYKNGEYAHGTKGIFQFYDGVLKTNGDIRKAIQLMLFIAKAEKPGRTHLCFCGSKEKFRRCHRDSFEKLVEIGKDNLKQQAYKIAEAAQLSDLYPIIRYT